MALPAIVPSLTHIYNASITTGSFPVKFKQAKLCPIYKKESVHERNNYRPISVLPIISKPLERHVATSYLEYLNSHGLLYRHQSAYRPYHSCETALLNLTDNWLNTMDKSNLGSILGPVLFSLYMNDLPLNIPEANVDVYADDTTLWKSNGDCIKIQNDLQSSLDCANVWFKQNHMKPNITKTKHLLIGTHQKLRHANISSLELNQNGVPIEEVKDEKLLGVKLNKYLSWNDQVNCLMKKLNSRFFLLKRAK
ncbi:Hypothetical predicted protein, partial [Paramuricea clavata]